MSAAPVFNATYRAKSSGITRNVTCEIFGAPRQYSAYAFSVRWSFFAHGPAWYAPVPTGCCPNSWAPSF